ncbi:hypothetical protein D3C76_1468070 [compost metagenome]
MRIIASLLQALAHALHQRQQALLHHRIDQPLLVAEVVVHQRRRHLALLGDGAQAGGVDAAVGEAVDGGVEQPLAQVAGIRQRAAGGA